MTSPNQQSLKRLAAGAALVIFAVAAPAAPPNNRVDLSPKLQPGQIITYAITYRTDKQTKTRSSVVIGQAPAEPITEVHALLRLEILSGASPNPRAVIHARSSLSAFDSDGAAQQRSDSAAPAPTIEFSILPDGRIDQLTGLDSLSPDQQQAWRQWASRFAAAAVFPRGGIKLSQKWKSQEPEKSPSPIAALTWLRESTYVRNDPCRPLRLNDRGDLIESEQPPDICAVILTTASLKQQSPAKDTTPDDFRVRQLRTSGTARGNNKTILYISLKTGLVVRSSDDADQAMSVTIAKADGSNRVHYDVEAKSTAQLQLVTTPAPRQNP
jgi:hypothetical protein